LKSVAPDLCVRAADLTAALLKELPEKCNSSLDDADRISLMIRQGLEKLRMLRDPVVYEKSCRYLSKAEHSWLSRLCDIQPKDSEMLAICDQDEPRDDSWPVTPMLVLEAEAEVTTPTSKPVRSSSQDSLCTGPKASASGRQVKESTPEAVHEAQWPSFSSMLSQLAIGVVANFAVDGQPTKAEKQTSAAVTTEQAWKAALAVPPTKSFEKAKKANGRKQKGATATEVANQLTPKTNTFQATSRGAKVAKGRSANAEGKRGPPKMDDKCVHSRAYHREYNLQLKAGALKVDARAAAGKVARVALEEHRRLTAPSL